MRRRPKYRSNIRPHKERSKAGFRLLRFVARVCLCVGDSDSGAGVLRRSCLHPLYIVAEGFLCGRHESSCKIGCRPVDRDSVSIANFMPSRHLTLCVSHIAQCTAFRFNVPSCRPQWGQPWLISGCAGRRGKGIICAVIWHHRRILSTLRRRPNLCQGRFQ